MQKALGPLDRQLARGKPDVCCAHRARLTSAPHTDLAECLCVLVFGAHPVLVHKGEHLIRVPRAAPELGIPCWGESVWTQLLPTWRLSKRGQSLENACIPFSTHTDTHTHKNHLTFLLERQQNKGFWFIELSNTSLSHRACESKRSLLHFTALCLVKCLETPFRERGWPHWKSRRQTRVYLIFFPLYNCLQFWIRKKGHLIRSYFQCSLWFYFEIHSFFYFSLDMICDDCALTNLFVSLPRDKGSLNCCMFIAGIVQACFDGSGLVSPFLLPSLNVNISN